MRLVDSSILLVRPNDEGSIQLKPHPKCLLTEFEDGTGVVLNLETKFYHTLNTSAVVLWKALEAAAGASTAPQLAGTLVSQFEVDGQTALADLASALAEFERDGLLIR